MYIRDHLVTKHQVLSLVESGMCSLQSASDRLGLSYRQVKRWYHRYRSVAGSLVDFGRVRPRGGGWNKIAEPIRREIVRVKQRWPRMSNPHVADHLAMEHTMTVAPSTVKRLLIEKGLYSPLTHQRRVFTRFEPAAFGERLQMDTTTGAWLAGYRRISVICVLDEYSRMIVGWQVVGGDETAWDNLCVLHRVFNALGLPKMLYTDNASMFKTIRHGKSAHQDHRGSGYETTIQRAMCDLGIVMFSHQPYQPESKGKIERFFRFMQERFMVGHEETTLAGLTTALDRWIRWYNERHVNRTTAQTPHDRQHPSVWRSVTEERLRRALCFHDTRRVDKCNAFSFEGTVYTIPTTYLLMRQTVRLEYTLSLVRVYHHDRFVHQFERSTLS